MRPPKKKGMIDTQSIVTGFMAILVIGMVINIVLGINDDVYDSMSGMAESTTAKAAMANTTANLEDSVELGANLPLVVIASLLVVVLMTMTRLM